MRIFILVISRICEGYMMMSAKGRSFIADHFKNPLWPRGHGCVLFAWRCGFKCHIELLYFQLVEYLILSPNTLFCKQYTLKMQDHVWIQSIQIKCKLDASSFSILSFRSLLVFPFHSQVWLQQRTGGERGQCTCISYDTYKTGDSERQLMWNHLIQMLWYIR